MSHLRLSTFIVGFQDFNPTLASSMLLLYDWYNTTLFLLVTIVWYWASWVANPHLITIVSVIDLVEIIGEYGNVIFWISPSGVLFELSVDKCFPN